MQQCPNIMQMQELFVNLAFQPPASLYIPPPPSLPEISLSLLSSSSLRTYSYSHIHENGKASLPSPVHNHLHFIHSR